MSDSSNPFDGGSAPAISFADKDEYGNQTSKPVGTKYTGVIVETPKVVQSRDYDTGKPASWPDGNPKWSVVIGLEVNGERMSLWAPKPSSMFGAIQESLKGPDGKVRNADIGGTLSVELVGFQKVEGKFPQKLYKAVYSPPNHFGGEEATPTSAPAGASAAPTSTGSDDEAAAKAAKIAAMTDEDRKLLGL